jgi:putative transcriptional regulator
MTAYYSICQGLTEALDFAAGKTAGAQVHQVNVTQVDVAAIRTSTGHSQSQLARVKRVATQKPKQGLSGDAPDDP